MTRAAALVLAVSLVLAGCSGVPLGGPSADGEDAGPEDPGSATVTGETQQWTVTVERVVDGDTLEVAFPDGHTENVRLLGVDTPEVDAETSPDEFAGVPDSEAGREWLRDWGHAASEFARTELLGEEVTISTDPEADARGGYGRLLVYVSHDGAVFNRRLLERGYARLYDAPFTDRDEYAAVERSAREDAVGLWGYEDEARLDGSDPPAVLRSANASTGTPVDRAVARTPPTYQTGSTHPDADLAVGSALGRASSTGAILHESAGEPARTAGTRSAADASPSLARSHRQL